MSPAPDGQHDGMHATGLSWSVAASPRFGRGFGAILLLVALAAVAGAAETLPFLHPLFASHAVLQRGKAVPIWGWTKPGETVTVSMEGKTASATAGADGKWLAKFGPFTAGGPFTLTVAGAQTV